MGLIAPTAAGAATVSLNVFEDAPGQPISMLVFRAADGERNEIEAVNEPDAIRVSDSLPLTPGPGCAATTTPNTVSCSPAPGLRFVDVELGDGADSAVLDLTGTVKGGPGADDIHGGGTLEGEGGDDILAGSSGSDGLVGAAGDDQLFGGSGTDRLEPGPGRDIVQSGAGSDTIRARDGAFDRIACGTGGRDTGNLDRLDFPGDTCFGSRLRRRGAPRALPLEATLGLTGRLRLDVACPFDFGRACRGTVIAKLGNKVVGRRRFRVARGTHAERPIRLTRRQIRKIRRSTRFGAYTGRFAMTVRARGRTVKARVPLSVEGR